MRSSRRQVCVIGLGHFGASLARSLGPHCEVLALDRNIARVNALSESVQQALCVDARDFSALAAVVSSSFDEAVVSIGEGMEASVLTTLHLKRIGVPVIRAKADSDDHASILGSVGATAVIFPERETAQRLAMQILNPHLLDFVALSCDHRLVTVRTPASFVGRSLAELALRSRFGVFVVAVKRPDGSVAVFLPGPDHVCAADEELTVIGRTEDTLRLPGAGPLVNGR